MRATEGEAFLEQVAMTKFFVPRELASSTSNDVARPSPQPKAQVQGNWGIDKRGRMRNFARDGYSHEPFVG